MRRSDTSKRREFTTVSSSQESPFLEKDQESSGDMPDPPSGSESVTSSRDHMAIAGFVCSLCVALIPALPFLIDADSIGFLLPVAAMLWVAGLVLSLLAKNRAARHRKLAKAGIIISIITPMLYVIVAIIIVVAALTWYSTF